MLCQRSVAAAPIGQAAHWLSAGALTVFDAPGFPEAARAIEDPRLFVHRGQLMLQVYAYMPTKDGHRGGRQFLARLERKAAATNGSISGGGWLLTQASQVVTLS